uniref:ST8 alpha-N-acetyl-neuraminide alpha-2,8-sialyltransferase 6 n=1 Tax=Salarias fasciatus TaxID=181472 RepID=A0A672GLU1_SALFA
MTIGTLLPLHVNAQNRGVGPRGGLRGGMGFSVRLYSDGKGHVFDKMWEPLLKFLSGNNKFDTCSVVGNGGILINSNCGKQIDSSQFVIRCNLAPLDRELEKDVGKKTSLVTANPSIFVLNRRRQFVESLRRFKDSMLLMPTFSYAWNTHLCQRAFQAIKHLSSPIRPVSFNPRYLRSLWVYWRSLGLKEARLSTGFMMVNLALELCNSVDLYGFWPFSVHPQDCHHLTNHYYDNMPVRKRLHAMPAEFKRLLKLHSLGILRIHLGDCGQ